MRTFWNINQNLTPQKEWQPNCWIQVTCPTDEEQEYLEQEKQESIILVEL